MIREEILEHQRREREFRGTEIGAAFARFESAVGRAWTVDCQENVSDRRLKEVWEKHDQARRDLVTLLMKHKP